jgi:LytS/YehU family sensor histidine kinase
MRSARSHLLLIATAMVWIIAYAAWTADWMVGDMPFVAERALRRIPLCLFGAACCWGIKIALDRLSGKRLETRLLAALGLCAAASAAYAALNTIVYYAIAPLWGSTNLNEVFQLSLVVAWVFLAWTALYFAIRSDSDARDARLRLADAETAALRARNQALAQQISPHFLFNSLNTVSGLIMDGEPARAERVTVALAGLLRRSLETDAREHVTLGEELDAVHRYLEIEQSRFESRLRVDARIPDELRGLAVPPMILQPLVENVVKHGVARSTGPVCLSIAAERSGDNLRIAISDDVIPDSTAAPPPGTGTGQANVRQRLALMYGDRASLLCAAMPGRGYKAELVMPARAHAVA